MNKFIRLFHSSIVSLLNDKRIFCDKLILRCFKWLPDSLFLRFRYYFIVGRRLILHNPKRFNEKLQWLKLYNQRPEYTNMVDKITVKDYVGKLIGYKYIIPTFKVWDNTTNINIDELPEQFVLKTNHDGGSGGVIICKNKKNFDFEAAKKKLEKSLNNNIYLNFREWPYKNVKPAIFAEELLEDSLNEELLDYKVMCFDGEPKLIQLHKGRKSHHTQDFYDLQWNKQTISQVGYPLDNSIEASPVNLTEMINLSRILANQIPFVRIDWYEVRGKLYFGEITFFDGSGFVDFEQDEINELLGSWITLPAKTIEK